MLFVNEASWKSLSTPTIDEHICLCHLRALFFILKGNDPDEMTTRSSSNQLMDVDSRYNVELSLNQKKIISDSVHQHPNFYSSILLPILQDFIEMLKRADHLRLTDLIKDDLIASYFFENESELADFPDDPTLTLVHLLPLYLHIEKSLANLEAI